MITVQPNIETDASLHAQQVADATREGRAWAAQTGRTEAEVIEWAAVVLRDGPTRMGWSDHETRQIALAYLEGWATRPSAAERLEAAARAVGGVARTLANPQRAWAHGVTQGMATTSPHFTLHPDGRLERHAEAWRAAVERGIIHQPTPPWLSPAVAEPCPQARPIRYMIGLDPATSGVRGATHQHD